MIHDPWSMVLLSAEERVEQEKLQYVELRIQNHKQTEDALIFADQMQYDVDALKIEVEDAKKTLVDRELKLRSKPCVN